MRMRVGPLEVAAFTGVVTARTLDAFGACYKLRVRRMGAVVALGSRWTAGGVRMEPWAVRAVRGPLAGREWRVRARTARPATRWWSLCGAWRGVRRRSA